MDLLKIVIIEDEEAHFQLMKRAIDKDFPLASVYHFKEAAPCLESLDEVSPDVIVTDYLLPGMNGIEFLEALNQRRKETPVIMITGQGDEGIAVKAMKLGAWDYLVKSAGFFTLLPSVIGKVVREQKLKESLQRSEKRFREFFQRSPIGIQLYDSNGQLIVVNQSCLDMFGVSDVGHLKGFNLFDDPNVSPEAKSKLLKGETVRYEAFFDFEKAKKVQLYKTTKSGNVYLDVLITPVGHGAGHLVSEYLVQIQDITERKRAEEALRKAHDDLERRVEDRTAELAKANEELKLEIEERKWAEEALLESEKKYSTLVENSLTGIYIDQDEKIVFANNRFAEIFGFTKEELIGIESWRLVHPEDRPLTRHLMARRLMGEDAPSEYEVRGLTKDGESMWIVKRNTRIEYQGKPAILGNVVNITEQKWAEEELNRADEELRDFVHIVSHDLKTPIIAIQGFSSRLRKKYREKLGDKGLGYLEHIRANARRMEMLVSNLVTLLRIGRVVPTVKDVSFLEIARSVSLGLEHRLKDSGIELIVAQNLPTVCCDRESIYQVFENLLVNAVKFTKGVSGPKIEVGYEDRVDFHQFHVRDNGIGIDPKYHRRVFEMFQRVEETQDLEGTGLGLAIVERIVGNQGGRVWVESEKGKGATFYFTLPKAPQYKIPI
ncbi:MAG: PAS domain S-box protein [Desulfobacterales bacterium]|nr:PAS domain S-box protein [Desulfobacterales bacterium]